MENNIIEAKDLKVDDNYLVFVGYDHSPSGFDIGCFNLAGKLEMQCIGMDFDASQFKVYQLPIPTPKEQEESDVKIRSQTYDTEEEANEACRQRLLIQLESVIDYLEQVKKEKLSHIVQETSVFLSENSPKKEQSHAKPERSIQNVEEEELTDAIQKSMAEKDTSQFGEKSIKQAFSEHVASGSREPFIIKSPSNQSQIGTNAAPNPDVSDTTDSPSSNTDDKQNIQP